MALKSRRDTLSIIGWVMLIAPGILYLVRGPASTGAQAGFRIGVAVVGLLLIILHAVLSKKRGKP